MAFVKSQQPREGRDEMRWAVSCYPAEPAMGRGGVQHSCLAISGYVWKPSPGKIFLRTLQNIKQRQCQLLQGVFCYHPGLSPKRERGDGGGGKNKKQNTQNPSSTIFQTLPHKTQSRKMGKEKKRAAH